MKFLKSYTIDETKSGFRATVRCPLCTWKHSATHGELGYAVTDVGNDLVFHLREHHKVKS